MHDSLTSIVIREASRVMGKTPIRHLTVSESTRVEQFSTRFRFTRAMQLSKSSDTGHRTLGPAARGNYTRTGGPCQGPNQRFRDFRPPSEEWRWQRGQRAPVSVPPRPRWPTSETLYFWSVWPSFQSAKEFRRRSKLVSSTKC